MESKSKKIENSFWNIQNIIIISLSFIIPLSLIFVNLLGVYAGFSIGNSIALLTAGLAITGMLYSNYRNNIRNQDQLDAAEKRLDKQLKEQKINLNQQLKSAERRLDKQLADQKKNLNRQLDSAKENLREQLIFDKKSNAVLAVYKIFLKYPLPIGKKMHKKDIGVKRDPEVEKKDQANKIREDLGGIMDEPEKCYYLPRKLKKVITELNNYYYESQPDPKNQTVSDDYLIEERIKEVYSQLEMELRKLKGI